MKAFARPAAVLGLAWVALVAASDPVPLEEAVLAEVNRARQDPPGYAERLREYRQFFEGDMLYLPGDDRGVVTHEGRRAVDEAIAFLERQAPLPPLSPGEILVLAARDHADAQGPAGATGHVSRDGASPGMRVERRGGGIYVGETISYGHGRADDVVRALIVDDGVPGRGHRKLLFDPGYRYAGVGCGAHARFRHICVVDLAQTADGSPSTGGAARMAGARVFTYAAKR